MSELSSIGSSGAKASGGVVTPQSEVVEEDPIPAAAAGIGRKGLREVPVVRVGVSKDGATALLRELLDPSAGCVMAE